MQMFVGLLCFVTVSSASYCNSQSCSPKQYVKCGKCVCLSTKAICCNVTGELDLPRNINALRISCSRFEKFSFSIISSNIRLNDLYFIDNQVKEIDNTAFKTQSFLSGLYITSTRFNHKTNELFVATGKIRNLKYLKLINVNLSHFITKHFSSVNRDKILSVDLTSNSFTILDFAAFSSFKCLRRLYFKNNILSEFIGTSSIDSLKIINLSGNKLANKSWSFCINSTHSLLKKVKRIYMANNQTDSYDERKFSCLQKLNFLDLSFNNFRHFNSKRFESHSSLDTLILSNNQLFEIKGARYPKSLININLNWNSFYSLSTLCGNTSFDTASNLQVLNVSNNRLTHSPLGDLRCFLIFKFSMSVATGLKV